ncbi:caspase domain-containing protein [Terasakiella sp. SH-1]|uniref:caspase family protein n=1 Tax=Terasakiella sp. SH-1 TaxID=2560057 RepID=UPI001430771D|nr:caspase domain-containing protein [Terasakiella sp. SH-1]
MGNYRILSICFFLLMLTACQSTQIIKADKNVILAPAESLEFSIFPKQDWQETGVSVLAGKEYELKANGMWSYGPICGIADPSGAGNAPICSGPGYVIDKNSSALVGKIGPTGKPFFVGFGVKIKPEKSGKLLMGPNAWDWLPQDNTGKMDVKVTRVGESYQVTTPQVQPAPSQPPQQAQAPVKAVSKYLGATTQIQGPRIALVIGNSDYRISPLRNPVNDARLMSKTLRSLGFDVIHEENATQRKIKRALNHFGDRLEKAGRRAVGLFYYAGHGVQVSGRNYLIPIQANIQNEKDVDVEAVAVDGALIAMEYARNDLNVVILDACRNNPYRSGFRSANRGLALIDAPRGSLIAYSTSPGKVAADGSGLNSPYTTAVVKAMSDKGVAIERMFRNVRNQVMQMTNQQQVPWEASSLVGGDFYFNP